jgi:hypothetical protein
LKVLNFEKTFEAIGLCAGMLILTVIMESIVAPNGQAAQGQRGVNRPP